MSTQLSDFKGVGESSCCGAGTYGEYLICEECFEHCEDVSEEKHKEDCECDICIK